MKWIKIGERIHQMRKELNLSLSALGVLIGKNRSDSKKVSHVTVRNWEAGAQIKKDNFDALCKALGVTQEWLEHGDKAAEYSKTLMSDGGVNEPPGHFFSGGQVEILNTNNVPLIDMVAAGDFTEVADPYPVGGADVWINCPVDHGDNTFAVRISGESMLPKFEHGEVIFCDPSKRPENGDYVIAKLTDENQATFKQLVIDDGKMLLKAINPDWHTKYIPINGNCHIVGKVIARLEKF